MCVQSCINFFHVLLIMQLFFKFDLCGRYWNYCKSSFSCFDIKYKEQSIVVFETSKISIWTCMKIYSLRKCHNFTYERTLIPNHTYPNLTFHSPYLCLNVFTLHYSTMRVNSVANQATIVSARCQKMSASLNCQ